ncbi:hypothetical protein [Pseudoclavibacter sp. AY1F1]|uniref:hypothetical protein n=1 Tax=Pseudoclavibacter sp. AY1F1 TaxID=2080583 RepID=UPI0011B00C07|nr:hypothetical protein [Pseudoclavibacter sp. AY1F1]
MTSWTVPPGVTEIEYTVLGAAGGASYNNGRGGAGAEIVGALAVTPGQSLQFIVGQGGIGSLAGSETTTGLLGGSGYGNGGPSGGSDGSTGTSASFVGASGGGGSAILVGGAPIVVAGGGGGEGVAVGLAQPVNAGQWQYNPTQAGGSGGDVTQPGNDANMLWSPNPYTPAISPKLIASNGGGAASGATGGAGGAVSTNISASTSPLLVDTATAAGLGGGAHVAATGGAGGAGAFAERTTVVIDNSVKGILPGGASGGGGGGGFAGGGGGGTVAAAYKGDYTVTSTSVPNALLGVASGGGAGSSLTPTGAVIRRGPNANSVPDHREPGLITIRHCATA